MNVAPLLHDAQVSHDRIVEELNALFAALDETIKDERFGDDPKRLIVPFDLMLQLELLRLALKTRKKREAIEFLRSMGSFQYELMKYLEEYAEVRGIVINVGYNSILALEPEPLGRFLAIAKAAVAPLWADALTAMANSDLIVERDIFQVLEDNLLRLVDCFLMIDETVTETEIRLAVETVRETMLAPIVSANDELFRRSEVK